MKYTIKRTGKTRSTKINTYGDIEVNKYVEYTNRHVNV